MSATPTHRSATAAGRGRTDDGNRSRIVAPVPRITLTVDETAEALGVGETLVRQLIASGDIPAIRLRGRLLVPVDGLRDAIGVITQRGAV